MIQFFFFLSLLNCITFLVSGVLETPNIWTHLWDQSRTKACTSKPGTLRLAEHILWNSSKLNSTPVHVRVCRPGSFLSLLLEKIARGLRTPSASAQTQHGHCLPLKRKIKSLERRGAAAGLLYHQFSSVMAGSLTWGGIHFTLPEGIQIRLSQADSSAGSLALSKLRVILFVCHVHNSALPLTCTVTSCGRWNLLKTLTFI